MAETNEILWTEFETAFLAAWTDTSKKQNAFNQLMRLTMNGWDMDTYIATFDHLTSAVGWDSNSEGTIAKFREGLSKGIHSKALDRDHIPHTIDEWKAAARTEVARAKEKYNAGLTRNQRRNAPKSGVYSNTQTNPRTQSNQSNAGVVPMEVDSATGQSNFKKLTPEERAQLAKEGCCFHCRLQGHMARDCPKNANRNTSSNTREATTETQTPNSPATTPIPTNKTSTTKLTRAQQIRALEEAMEDEERATYLDARVLRSDFTYLRRYIGLHRFLSDTPSSKPMYDTISRPSHIRYDLASFICTIRSRVLLVYDINLGATATTILSTRGVQIPIYLVTSAMDSLGKA